jgi:hypothetical protein
MYRLRLLFLMAAACASLTGCLYYPVTLHDTEPSTLSSPYRTINVMVDRGTLSFQIKDPAIKDADFGRMKLVEAVLITDAGKQLPLKLWGTNHGDGVTFLFRLNEVGFDDDHFGLRITTSLDGQVATITGNFTIHSHTKVIDVMDALDPGGK